VGEVASAKLRDETVESRALPSQVESGGYLLSLFFRESPPSFLNSDFRAPLISRHQRIIGTSPYNSLEES